MGQRNQAGNVTTESSKSCNRSFTQQTKVRNIIVSNEHRFAQGGPAMTPKEELKELILSLTPEELETAVTVFRDYFLERQAEQQPPYRKDQKPNQVIPA